MRNASPLQSGFSPINALWGRKKEKKGSPQRFSHLQRCLRVIHYNENTNEHCINEVLTFDESHLTTRFGFCSGERCNDGMHVIKPLQEISYLSNRKFYLCRHHSSIHFWNYDCNECLDLIQELYWSTKSYASGEGAQYINVLNLL